MATLKMERRFAATQGQVFDFVTKPENLLRWWGPQGTRIEDHHLDFSRTGDWFATMISPSGQAHKVGGVVRMVTPPRMIELTLCFIDTDGTRGPESVIRFDVQAQGGEGAVLHLTQTGLDPEHIADMRDKGWASALDRLQHLITDAKTPEGDENG